MGCGESTQAGAVPTSGSGLAQMDLLLLFIRP